MKNHSTAKPGRRCVEYISGDCKLAATRFINALMAHLAPEEVWFEVAKEHQKERLRIVA